MARRTFAKDAGERVPIQARTTTQVRDRIEQAAARSGRSLSQEMEMRLERSLTIENVALEGMRLLSESTQPIVEMFGGDETFSLARDIAWMIGAIEEDMGKPWHSDGESRAQVYKVLEGALQALLSEPRPPLAEDSVMRRAVRLAKYLPDQPEKKALPLPKGARFMTAEELKDFFYLRDD